MASPTDDHRDAPDTPDPPTDPKLSRLVADSEQALDDLRKLIEYLRKELTLERLRQLTQ